MESVAIHVDKQLAYLVSFHPYLPSRVSARVMRIHRHFLSPFNIPLALSLYFQVAV